jgi:hypothetical protein
LDDGANPPYLPQRDEVRSRGGNNWAELTVKRETENYLAANRIEEEFGFPVAFGDMDSVPELVARTQHDRASPIAWNALDDVAKKQKIGKAKKRLNHNVTSRMTWNDIQAADPNSDIIRLLEGIRDRLV